MLERDLQATVVEAAHLGGWRVAHFRTAINQRGHHQTPIAFDARGFPDLLLVRDRVMAIECKSASGRVSVDQAEWLRAFRDAGCEALVCAPDNLQDVCELLVSKPRRAA